MTQSPVIIKRLHGAAELEDARLVCDLVWPKAGGGTEITKNLVTAMEHAGGYVSAAYLPEAPSRPVGAVVSFIARHRDAHGTWHTHLHSHMAAVLEEARDRGIGRLLKFDQREWALENQLAVVSWTFDPLVRRNARLNLLKLGATVNEYLVNFYGDMDDDLNTGDESDRMMAWWEVGSERVTQAVAGTLRPVTVLPAGARVIELPDDIVALRGANPAAAHDWRLRVREQVQSALADGLVLYGVDAADSYVFGRKED